MAAKIEAAYAGQVGKVKLIASGGGGIELSLDGQLIYSKLATGSFPNQDDIIRLIGQK